MTQAIASDAEEAAATGGQWEPLKSRLFAVIFITSVFSLFAVSMNGLAAAWLLTDITDSPAAVALLQAAVTLPSFALALVAGALADVANRKRIIQLSLIGSGALAAVFAVLSATDNHSQMTVLALTGALGVLSALAAPAWLAVIPGLVARPQLGNAMTLSAAGESAAMAIGPAIGGFVIAAAGPTWVFWLNLVVFAASFGALAIWQPKQHNGLPAEHLGSAMRLGLQYVRYDRPLKVVIAKIVPFALASVALMSLLPAIARFRLDAGPAMFGILSGAGGVGAVIALFSMPWVRERVGPDAIISAAMLAQGAAMALLATTTSIPVAFIALVIAGVAMLSAVSTVMTVVQVVLPGWIRGRGIAVFLLALDGSFAIGALTWGGVAQLTSIRTAMLAAAAATAIGAIVVTFIRISRYVDVDSSTHRCYIGPSLWSQRFKPVKDRISNRGHIRENLGITTDIGILLKLVSHNKLFTTLEGGTTRIEHVAVMIDDNVIAR